MGMQGTAGLVARRVNSSDLTSGRATAAGGADHRGDCRLRTGGTRRVIAVAEPDPLATGAEHGCAVNVVPMRKGGSP